MAVTDLFSKRQKRLRGEVPDVYQYELIPTPLRIQVMHIMTDTVGEAKRHYENPPHQVFKAIHDILCREYGLPHLPDKRPGYARANSRPEFDDLVYSFMTDATDYEQVLDVIELMFRAVNTTVRYGHDGDNKANKAIEELNIRFREHGVGYQFESGSIVRVDSQFLHAEAVKPTLVFLSDKQYAGANQEFLKAFENYRKGDTKECLSESLKAFESTMKAICDKRNWTYEKTDTAKALIDVCFQKGLIPPLLQSHITSLRTGLESGIPTVRNKLSAHGQGSQVVDVPPHYASYMLHLTATTIQFLVRSEKAFRRAEDNDKVAAETDSV